MRTQSHELMLPVDHESAWEFLSDYRNDLLWRDEIDECELVTGSPGEVGAMYRARLQWEGLHSHYHVVCADLHRPTHLAYRTTVHGAPTVSEYTLHDRGASTLLVVVYALAMEGTMSLLEPFAWGLLTRWARDDLQRLGALFSEKAGLSLRPDGAR